MKIICISGKARHGKDFTAEVIKEQIEAYNEQFGYNYKVLIFHYADLLKHIAKSMFGWDGEKDAKGRKLLQYIGTDVVRAKNPDFWVDYAINMFSLFEDEWDFIIVPDCRFPNEINKLRQYGFTNLNTLRVNRIDCITGEPFDNGLTIDAKAHISETALDNFEFDCILENSGDDTYKNQLAMYSLGLVYEKYDDDKDKELLE